MQGRVSVGLGALGLGTHRCFDLYFVSPFEGHKQYDRWLRALEPYIDWCYGRRLIREMPGAAIQSSSHMRLRPSGSTPCSHLPCSDQDDKHVSDTRGYLNINIIQHSHLLLGTLAAGRVKPVASWRVSEKPRPDDDEPETAPRLSKKADPCQSIPNGLAW